VDPRATADPPLQRFRARFYKAGGEPGSEDFYADHVAHGRLYDGARRLVSDRATPGILNAHKGEPGAVPVQDSSRLAAHVTLWLGSA
jgi:hypothetical protein